MKYYLDTEFIEGPQTKRFLGINIGQTKPTIDLISIALVAEDGREYYAVSKDFNLYDAWNRYQWEQTGRLDLPGINRSICKRYWIRENVLMPIFFDFAVKDFENAHYKDERYRYHMPVDLELFKNVWGNDYKWFCKLIAKYGKPNEQIAAEICSFVNPDLGFHIEGYNVSDLKKPSHPTYQHFQKHNVGLHDNHFVAQPDFYAYFADYDWVVFCWLFGKMNALPKGFPQYCRDLKQVLDEKAIEKLVNIHPNRWPDLQHAIDYLKAKPNYPKKANEHTALPDARWNKQLHEFINHL
jgi:hypothetical protein